MYIDPDLVINKEAFKTIESNAICSICDGIIINPIQCNICENSFCETCIDDWKKKQGGNSCPFRCSNPTFKSSRLVKSILSNLIFKCQNQCNMQIPYLDLKSHYEENCPKLKIDFKAKYFEYKKKYEDLLIKYKELENHTNSGNILRIRPNLNLKNEYKEYKSKYHTHTLMNKTNDLSSWICDICKAEYNAKTEGRFRCENCDFDICFKCILLEKSRYNFDGIFMCKYHEHLLNDKTFQDSNWICNLCKKSFAKKSIKRFRCDKCDFDVCNDCKIKEELNQDISNLTLGV